MPSATEPCFDLREKSSPNHRTAEGLFGIKRCRLFGEFPSAGLRFEWHDFECAREVDWTDAFHPESVEICLNLLGDGRVGARAAGVRFAPMTSGFYRCGEKRLRGARIKGQRHRFLTVGMSYAFLRRHLRTDGSSLHPLVREVVRGPARASKVAPTKKLDGRVERILHVLREPPVPVAARRLWFQTKALELAAELFFQSPPSTSAEPKRRHRLAAERAEKVVALLRANLAAPPSLREIGRQVGCSPFHLSRAFSDTLAMTIPQFLRKARMERAAELLRSGTHNVTETALEVGYQSLSHFSQAFHETFGCCPGLYPLQTSTQTFVRARPHPF